MMAERLSGSLNLMIRKTCLGDLGGDGVAKDGFCSLDALGENRLLLVVIE